MAITKSHLRCLAVHARLDRTELVNLRNQAITLIITRIATIEVINGKIGIVLETGDPVVLQVERDGA